MQDTPRRTSQKPLQNLEQAEWLTEAPPKVDVIEDDEKDNMFLECAIALEVKYIVSGDHHLLNLEKYQGVTIITVREFMRLLANS